jgi:hypothetical protein
MHFTYSNSSGDDLRQGDILQRTPELNEALNTVHPYFHDNPSNKFFMVLSQSCDLVCRKNGECKTAHIVVSPIKPLNVILNKKFATLHSSDAELEIGFSSSAKRNLIKKFLERLHNNNDPEYFFVYRSPEHEIIDDHCAVLGVSIALKTSLHYKTLVDARILSLQEVFQHKLGFLIGENYSRIGTQDWVPEKYSEEKDFSSYINGMIEQTYEQVDWLEDSVYNKISKEFRKLNPDERTKEKYADLIEIYKSTKTIRKKDFIEQIKELFADLGVPEETIIKYSRRVSNDSKISTLIR